MTSKTKDLTKILEAAIRIAESASETALSYFRQALLIEMKENFTPVTVADKKTEEVIRKELERQFPDFGIVGEEFGEVSADSDLVWTIDPIDGTRSFIRGIPLWGTLLGLLEKGRPILGVMVLPALRETYSAAKGLGAFCNNQPLHVSAIQRLDSALISVGDAYTFEDVGKSPLLTTLTETAELTRGYTDCFGHALLMRGSVDAMIDPVVALWDVAPLACIIQEAGGKYFSLDGEWGPESTSFVSCTPGLQKELKALLGVN